MGLNLVVATIIAIFCLHIDSYLGPIFLKSIVRGGGALLFLLSLLNIPKKYFITVLILTASIIFWVLMPAIPPYEDQQELNLYRKTAMACSSLGEIYDKDLANHYAYLPLTLYTQIPWVVWGIDIRYFYLFLILLEGILIYLYAPENLKIMAAVILILCPELFLSTLNIENHTLSLLGVMLILIFFPLRKQIPFLSSFFLVVGLGFREQATLLLPFIIIYLFYRKEYKFILLILLFSALLILPPIALNPYGFYIDTFWRQGIQLPQKLWLQHKTNISINAQGALVALGINPSFVWNKIPWLLIQISGYFSILGYYIFTLYRKKSPEVKSLFYYGLIGSLFFIFTARKMRVFPAYYLILIIPLAFWNYKNLEIKMIKRKTVTYLRIGVFLGLLFFTIHYFIGKHYQNLWCKNIKTRVVEFEKPGYILRENISYLPDLPLSLKRGFGFMNNQERYNLTFYLPEGQFLLRIYDNKNHCLEKQVQVKYYRLRIPIYLRERKIFIYEKEFSSLKKIEITPLSRENERKKSKRY